MTSSFVLPNSCPVNPLFVSHNQVIAMIDLVYINESILNTFTNICVSMNKW